MADAESVLMAGDERPALSPAQAIRRQGLYWTITFDGTTCRLRTTRGLDYLAYLLCRPHEAISALMLERSASKGLPKTRATTRLALGDTRERARVNVTRAIATVMRRLDTQHPSLAAHLRVTIKTGAFCRYTPDPRLPLQWSE